jgi:hypothetical protein
VLSVAAFASSLLALTFVVVPLDDRPVTAQLPRLLGAIAGVRVAEPPASLLGRYLVPGDPDAVLRWLRDEAPPDARAYIVSADMTAYGGLVASRIPGVTRALAYTRLEELAALHAARPGSFDVFGTVMRLAPTGVPALGAAAAFPFSGDVWPALAAYAALPDPPRSGEDRAAAERLRAQLGAALDSYLAVRARDRDVDLFALRTTAEGGFDRIVLGQDDAGPVGLHLRDLAALRAFAARWLPASRASIEPGADELAMALLAAALAREVHAVPRVRVVYSRPGGGAVADPIEFAPVATTVADLIQTCGALDVTATRAVADIILYVRVPGTSDADESAFAASIAAAAKAPATSRPLVAVADLSFLVEGDAAEQRRLTDDLIGLGAAGSIDAFASWNTVANTVGTALPEAIAVLAGKRLGTYDARAHATFTLMRYIDDVAFHTAVRPRLIADLAAAGTSDHTYLTPGVAQRVASWNRGLLWPDGLTLLDEIAPQFRDAGFTITLPWDRTFETGIDLRLQPR